MPEQTDNILTTLDKDEQIAYLLDVANTLGLQNESLEKKNKVLKYGTRFLDSWASILRETSVQCVYAHGKEVSNGWEEKTLFCRVQGKSGT